MEGDPFFLIEGMTIAGLAVGATQGYIYLRGEYPQAHKALKAEKKPCRPVSWVMIFEAVVKLSPSSPFGSRRVYLR